MKDSAYVIKFRQSRTAFLPTPVVSWQVIDSWMTAQTGEVQAINAVAAYLCTKDQEIAGLSQVPVLVSFYLRLHSELGCRVSKADLGLPVRDVLKKYDRDGALRADWEQFKTAWAAVVESIHQEGCASGMGERGFEFQSAAINDETLFLALISDPKNEDNPEGEIFKMIKLGVANVQERVLEKLTTSYGKQARKAQHTHTHTPLSLFVLCVCPEKLNPNDMLFDSENKSDFIAAALNKNTPNNRIRPLSTSTIVINHRYTHLFYFAFQLRCLTSAGSTTREGAPRCLSSATTPSATPASA